jgi:hypothetical protein
MNYILDDETKIALRYSNTVHFLENEIPNNFETINYDYYANMYFDNSSKKELVSCLLKDSEDLQDEIYDSIDELEQTSIFLNLINPASQNKWLQDALQRKVSNLAISYRQQQIEAIIEYLKVKNFHLAEKSQSEKYLTYHDDKYGSASLDSERNPF